jgi:hypothetical protein
LQGKIFTSCPDTFGISGVYSLRADKFRSENLARQQIDREADIVVGDSENAMPVPDQQRVSHLVVDIDSAILQRTSPKPEIIRTTSDSSLDFDQLAAVLMRLLDL